MSHKHFIIFVLSFFILSTACSSAQNTQTNNDNQATTNLAQTQTTVQQEEDYQPVALDPKDIVSPLQSIKDLDKMIESYHLGQNLLPEQLNENRILKQKIIRGTFDIKELCRLSLGKHWLDIKDKEQNNFVALMTQLLETKAIFSKEQLKGTNKYYKLDYKKEEYDDAEKKKATVHTNMFIPKENITLNITYKMLLTPYGWKIYDVIVDDASLMKNYKFQFDRIITKSGFPDLITRMNKKLQDIQAIKEETAEKSAKK